MRVRFSPGTSAPSPVIDAARGRRQRDHSLDRVRHPAAAAPARGRAIAARMPPALTGSPHRHSVAACAPVPTPTLRPPSGIAPSPRSRPAACRPATRTGPAGSRRIPARSRSSTSCPRRSGSRTSCSPPPGSRERRSGRTTCSATGSMPTGWRCARRPHPRHPDERGRAVRAARARARRDRGAARAARGRRIRRAVPVPRPVQLPVHGASAARPGRRPEQRRARMRGERAGARAGPAARGRLARRHRPQSARRAVVPTTSAGSRRSSGPSTTIAANGCARPLRSPQPTRRASSRAT